MSSCVYIFCPAGLFGASKQVPPYPTHVPTFSNRGDKLGSCCCHLFNTLVDKNHGENNPVSSEHSAEVPYLGPVVSFSFLVLHVEGSNPTPTWSGVNARVLANCSTTWCHLPNPLLRRAAAQPKTYTFFCAPKNLLWDATTNLSTI
jgi:hypothetical protein